MNEEQKRALINLIGAAEYAKDQLETARQYFPKSIHNHHKFRLLNAIATMAIALEDMEKSKLADNLLD